MGCREQVVGMARTARAWSRNAALAAVLAACAASAGAQGTATPVIVSFRDAVARSAPAVVTIHSARTLRSRLPFSPVMTVQGLGSGVVLDREGSIVTNHHVVENASEIVVVLPDGAPRPTRIVGTDPDSDLALLKIDAPALVPIEPADLDGAAVGDVVLAVGNPLGIGQTVTQGILSAIVRRGMQRTENFLQTDAAINPGNSGGALVDTAGRLLGINAAIVSRSGGSEGIGFAIPVDLVRTVVDELRAKGRVDRAWLGVATTQDAHGARVVAVQAEGPAERAGILPGDALSRIGDRTIRHAYEANGAVIGAAPGARVPVQLTRRGKPMTLDVVLAALPAPRATP